MWVGALQVDLLAAMCIRSREALAGRPLIDECAGALTSVAEVDHIDCIAGRAWIRRREPRPGHSSMYLRRRQLVAPAPRSDASVAVAPYAED